MNQLDGKTAVVTGVTSGIGEALAARLCAAGMQVAGVARDAEKLRRAVEGLHGRLRPFQAELTDPASRSACFAELERAVGAVDVVVLNAAEVVYELPTRLPIERWRALLEVNLLAGVELIERLRPKLRTGAHVVALSSAVARSTPNARFAPYAITKVAVERYTEALRLELEPAGVKVTLIVPGLVETPIYDKVDGFAKTRAKIKEQVPTWLAADDVAEAILWALARPAHVTVSELVILPQGQAR